MKKFEKFNAGLKRKKKRKTLLQKKSPKRETIPIKSTKKLNLSNIFKILIIFGFFFLSISFELISLELKRKYGDNYNYYLNYEKNLILPQHVII